MLFPALLSQRPDAILSSMREMKRTCPAAIFLLLLLTAAVPASAEEFYMKDGTRVVGVILSYDENTFRVQTSFGVALLEKSKIQRIVFSKTPKRAVQFDLNRPITSAVPVVEAPSARIQPPSFDNTFFSRTATKHTNNLFPHTRLPAPIPSRPKKIVEQITSTAYINHTFNFSIYKPPTWNSYPGLVQPDTQVIAALGTSDETTLLLIGWEFFEGSNVTYARLSERSLEYTYADYQKISEGIIQIGGKRVFQRRFSGEAEGRYWTGWVVYVSNGSEHYTFLGLTSAGEFSPLQEIVLRRVISSLRFFDPRKSATPTARR